eukprot:jgi/Botrbrau1/19207/Bobra.0077s0109.2
MALVAIAIAFLLALASTANCRGLLSQYAGASTNPPNDVVPSDPPAGSVRKNIQGEFVGAEKANGPMECAKICANYESKDPQTRRGTGRYANYYNYCNSLTGCSPYYLIGRCNCVEVSGAPQYLADTTSQHNTGSLDVVLGQKQMSFSPPPLPPQGGRAQASKPHKACRCVMWCVLIRHPWRWLDQRTRGRQRCWSAGVLGPHVQESAGPHPAELRFWKHGNSGEPLAPPHLNRSAMPRSSRGEGRETLKG